MADIELRHDLIGISTIFGIGISLLVEGMIVLVISLASVDGTRNRMPRGAAEPQSETIHESQEIS